MRDGIDDVNFIGSKTHEGLVWRYTDGFCALVGVFACCLTFEPLLRS
jgi:hypothetical protein